MTSEERLSIIRRRHEVTCNPTKYDECFLLAELDKQLEYRGPIHVVIEERDAALAQVQRLRKALPTVTPLNSLPLALLLRRRMIWKAKKEPQKGDRITIKRFAWLPIECGDKVLWFEPFLETLEWYPGGMGMGWPFPDECAEWRVIERKSLV